jgi:APA family basic amino acid/polyamine antiporter
MRPLRTSDSATAPVKTLGLWACVSLVAGNIIGSGIFLLPSSLAPYGTLAVAGWLVTAAGAICLALVFARLSRMMPAAGGPYAYTRAAFGDFMGFWVAWGYWIALWTGNAAIAVALGSYLKVFIPAFEGNALYVALAAVAAVWAFTVVNARGIRSASAVQIVTVVLKLLPLLAVGTVGLAFVERSNFEPLIPDGTNPLQAISAAATLTLWAFLGIESATIPADAVAGPERTIPRATVIGTALSAAVYIATTVAVMGSMSREALSASQAPIADAARLMWGDWAYYAVGAGAIVSCAGTLNGWMLLAGQFPSAAARDGSFPAPFARLSARGVPLFATVVAAALVTLLLAFNYSGAATLVSVFNFTILLATLANLIPYVFCSVAPALIARRAPHGEERPRARDHAIAAVAFLFSVGAVYGAGAQTALLGVVLMLLGVPVYAWLRKARG